MIGFSSSATEWFASFLTHREQCVLLDGTTSAPLTPKSGIPQGTVLGPVLFLILLTIFPSPPRANVRSLLMIQHCTLPVSPAYQAVHVLVLISTQQPHRLKDGACSLAPPRASFSQLEGQRRGVAIGGSGGSDEPTRAGKGPQKRFFFFFSGIAQESVFVEKDERTSPTENKSCKMRRSNGTSIAETPSPPKKTSRRPTCTCKARRGQVRMPNAVLSVGIQ